MPVAIITAASKGMGAATARLLAQKGYQLGLLATSSEIMTLAKDLNAVALQGSVLDDGDIARLVEKTYQRYGRIDAVVNNTGHPPKGDLLTLRDEDWHHGLDLIILSIQRLLRKVTPMMERHGGGSIVNITAFGAAEPDAGFPISSVLRAGLSAYTKLYATRYAAAKIRINNVLPGFIDSYPVMAERVEKIPLRRYGTVEEVAHTIAFLLSPEAGYITGQNILVDGGLVRGI